MGIAGVSFLTLLVICVNFNEIVIVIFGLRVILIGSVTGHRTILFILVARSPPSREPRAVETRRRSKVSYLECLLT